MMWGRSSLLIPAPVSSSYTWKYFSKVMKQHSISSVLYLHPENVVRVAEIAGGGGQPEVVTSRQLHTSHTAGLCSWKL